jgi:hypothetical protein
MVSSVNAKFMAVEKEKKRQRTLAKQQAKEGVITPPEVVLETVIKENILEVLEVIENVEPKEKKISESKKPKKKSESSKKSKSNKKVFSNS